MAGTAKSFDHCLLTHALWKRFIELHLGVWVERVASKQNIADNPSRLGTVAHACCTGVICAVQGRLQGAGMHWRQAGSTYNRRGLFAASGVGASIGHLCGPTEASQEEVSLAWFRSPACFRQCGSIRCLVEVSVCIASVQLYVLAVAHSTLVELVAQAHSVVQV